MSKKSVMKYTFQTEIVFTLFVMMVIKQCCIYNLFKIKTKIVNYFAFLAVPFYSAFGVKWTRSQILIKHFCNDELTGNFTECSWIVISLIRVISSALVGLVFTL